jgi:DNA-binding NarL/FixJ family response regulator
LGDDVMSEPLRVLLADDHALFRRGLREVLEEDGAFRVVAEAGDGEEAVRLAKELETGGLDLVLMDLEMPKLNGIGATRRLLAEVPGPKIVILTASVQDTDLFMAVENGVVGFLNKDMNPDALVRTLEDVCRTEGLAMTRATAAKAFGYLQRRVSGATPQPEEPAPSGSPAASTSADRTGLRDHPALGRLSPREREVFESISQGLRDRDIAEHLVLTENTVKTHVKRILRKLGVRNRAEAVGRLQNNPEGHSIE